MTAESERHKQTIVVGLGGGECSGKSYMANELEDLSKGSQYRLVVAPLDGYLRVYREERMNYRLENNGVESLAFRIGDHPDCFDFQELCKDVEELVGERCLKNPRWYDYEVGRVVYGSEPIVLSEKAIILVEGIFALHDSLLHLYNLTFFMETDLSTVWRRYRERHNNRRDKDLERTRSTFYDAVIPAYDKFIAPTKRNSQRTI